MASKIARWGRGTRREGGGGGGMYVRRRSMWTVGAGFHVHLVNASNVKRRSGRSKYAEKTQ